MRRHIQHLKNAGVLTRKKFFALAFCINLAFIVVILLNALSFPNTIVGSINVGLKTRSAIQSRLVKSYSSPIHLTINDQTYDVTWEHLGVYMDPEAILSHIFLPNSRYTYTTLINFVQQAISPRKVDPVLRFSQEFYEFIDKVNDYGKKGHDVVYIDQDNKQATLYIPKQRYAVDTRRLQEELENRFGAPDITIVVPLTETPSDLEETISSTNTRLMKAYKDPLTVIVGINGTNHFLTLSPEDLKRYTTTRLMSNKTDVVFDVNNAAFLPDIKTALSVFQSSFNPQTATDRIGNSITNALTTRYHGGTADSVKVGVDSGPNTDGTVAEKYIEVDISQQKLFTFRNNTLLKTYRVSTGKDYPTPIGTFKILNKIGLGFSAIYNVWLPYWMGFKFSEELHAYFGIHELPYYYSGSNKIQRPREFIGAPNTGGCVALDIGDAREVYQFADIGTHVVIYP